MISTKYAFILLIVVFISSIYLGFGYQFYTTIPIFDVILHFLGGFFVGMLVYSYHHREFTKNSPFFQIIALVGITIMVGVFWEFLEYTASLSLTQIIHEKFQYNIYFMGDLDDTITDLFMDTLGVISYLIINAIIPSRRSL